MFVAVRKDCVDFVVFISRHQDAAKEEVRGIGFVVIHLNTLSKTRNLLVDIPNHDFDITICRRLWPIDAPAPDRIAVRHATATTATADHRIDRFRDTVVEIRLVTVQLAIR